MIISYHILKENGGLTPTLKLFFNQILKFPSIIVYEMIYLLFQIIYHVIYDASRSGIIGRC
jgi:hypothetical protein